VHKDARHELAPAEWRDEMIVRADLEPDDAVDLFGLPVTIMIDAFKPLRRRSRQTSKPRRRGVPSTAPTGSRYCRCVRP
jgi:hypothetical protein